MKCSFLEKMKGFFHLKHNELADFTDRYSVSTTRVDRSEEVRITVKDPTQIKIPPLTLLTRLCFVVTNPDSLIKIGSYAGGDDILPTQTTPDGIGSIDTSDISGIEKTLYFSNFPEGSVAILFLKETI